MLKQKQDFLTCAAHGNIMQEMVEINDNVVNDDLDLVEIKM